jgi:hypothetical protein
MGKGKSFSAKLAHEQSNEGKVLKYIKAPNTFLEYVSLCVSVGSLSPATASVCNVQFHRQVPLSPVCNCSNNNHLIITVINTTISHLRATNLLRHFPSLCIVT